MIKNIGNIDKAIRFIAAIVIAVFYKLNYISGTTAIVLLSLAGILIVTSFLSFCPLYLPFGISTRKKINKS